jgi:tricorn protease interacting factor F2/3
MEQKLRFLGAMCGFQDKKLLAKTLDGDKILWPWLKKNWKKINKKVGHGNPLFNRIVASIAGVADDSMENEIKLFFKKNPTPGTERTQKQTLERIRINSKFLRVMRKEFKNG